MSRIFLFLAFVTLFLTGQAWAEEPGRAEPAGHAAAGPGRAAPSQGAHSAPAASHVSASRAPVVINMNHGSSGGHNRNFPSQHPAVVQQQARPAQPAQPNYGRTQQWDQTVSKPAPRAVVQTFQRPSVQSFQKPGIKAAVVVHHHAYTAGYVRKKLQNIGVRSEPGLITDRAEIIHTDRAHSVIQYPKFGQGHLAITAKIVSPRSFGTGFVADQLMVVDSPEWRAKLNLSMTTENQPGRYYWHEDAATRYCHYIDNSGYHWYGWYNNDQYFWTRYFGDRWWFYDSDYDRWCFWNNGFWWWQDPYHVGDLYCYNNSTYIPCNSSDDQVVVTAEDNNSSLQTNTSPDGTRVVKLDSQTGDAFLYDTANPPTFDPVYLASGVQSVQFSDPSTGRPMQIILKLSDGTFDMFDAQGNSYSPGTYDQDQANETGEAPPPPNM